MSSPECCSTHVALPSLVVDRCFEIVADRQPAAQAILSDGGAVSYAELDRQANALAHRLLAYGVAPEEGVGVFTERSAFLPAAFLAILKARGAYVPMGADLPPQRLANMACQCGMRFLIALDGLEPPDELRAALSANAAGAVSPIFRPEDASPGTATRPGLAGSVTDLAAILFTSGSTGQPKGVLLEHNSCLNMGYGHIDAQAISPADRILLAAAPGFILGFRELVVPLLAGAAFVPVSRALLDEPAGLLSAMSRHRVSVAMFTPSYLRLFQGAVPDGLRCLLTAGERPNVEDARAYARRLEYWNLHGATEACGTICQLRVDPDGSGPLSSGRPFANTSVYLLDSDGRQVPPGELGEIHVLGPGVARGYLNQSDLTAARFVETPYGRAYRTNDLGRWNRDGNLETLGRADDVVKVSGQTVSVGEIEQTLLRREGVTRAAVVQHEGRLVAFVESLGAGLALEDWHGFLGRTLPAYMLPAQVTTLSQMPINSYGKVDRLALAALAREGSSATAGLKSGAPPEGEMEQKIAAIWEEILNVRPVLREDNFFALGGTSLLSIAISQRLQALGCAATAQMVLAATTVAALARKIAQAPPLPPPPDNASEDVATSGQEDFWVAWRLGLGATGTTITRILAAQGTHPTVDSWQAAWSRVVARHAALRSAFFEGAGGRLCWRTVDTRELPVTISVDYCNSAEQARDRIAERAHTPFVLTKPPLARAGLAEIAGSGETLFWFTLHHSVVDGLSARIVQEELHSLLLGRSLPPAPNGIAQASRAERHYLASAAFERDRSYWGDLLDNLVREGGQPFQEFRTDYRRPSIPGGECAAPLVERLDAQTVATLGDLARKQGVGLHALLLALLSAEVDRRNERSRVILGSGISVRPPGAERAVGHFVNLLPVVLSPNGTLTLAGQISAAQQSLTETVEHGAYPSGRLYREFRERHPSARPHSRTSLFDISLTANPSRVCADAKLSLAPKRLPGERVQPAAGLDLAFSYEPIDDETGGLELALVWNPNVYREETARAWLRSFASWARWLAEDPRRVKAPLPALLPEEAALLKRWEPGRACSRPPQRFHELFDAVATNNPHRPAVVSEAGTCSYEELQRQANRVAWALLTAGVRHEQPVAVLTECSADLPGAMLGIWKAGAAYLPLALEQPAERLAYIACDAGARTLIVLDGHPVPRPLAERVETILRPEAWEGAPGSPVEITGSPRDLAYIIYTSGTSGTPKGVLIQHDSLVNTSYASGELFGLTPEDRFSLVATPGFDASLWEMGGALLHGMALVPVSRALRDDPWALKRWYKEYGVTVAFHVSSYLRVSRETPFEGLRVLVTGGEAPTHEDARYHVGHSSFWNAYGPTETCIFVCAENLSAHIDPHRPLAVGTPLPNTRFSIRREDGVPAPPGVVGEVWIGGAGLARGYLNQPELTARRFVDTLDGRFYRTGDLGLWTEDGRLELAGRLDDQVKLHGQRLEPGEIEQALRSHPAVIEAVALLEPSARETKALRGFVRLRPGVPMPGQAEWRTWLGERLPPYMVPASVTSVGIIPLNPQGKIDREILLRLPREHDAGLPKDPPRGEMEILIAGVWEALLGGTVFRDDNFFALGGNSLLAVAVAHRLSSELARPVAARELFAAPALAGFARRIGEPLGCAASVAQPLNSDRATEGQREFWVAEAAGLDTRTFTIPMLRAVEGGMPSSDRWEWAWSALVARHPALRTSFEEDADGRLRFRVAPAVACALEIVTRFDRTSARAFIRERQAERFCMKDAPLWRAGLVEVAGSGEHVFWLALHHSVGDGHSLGILARELGALLRGEILPPLTSGFAESAGREEAYLAGPACDEDARYWRDLLSAQPDSSFAEVPLDFPRAQAARTGTHRFTTRLDSAAAQALKALARQYQTSLHAVMLTLLAWEARRRTGRQGVVIGTTASVRETAAEAQIVGYYVNMLPLPCHVPCGAAFGDLLRGTRDSLAAALQHGRYPFARIYREFWSGRPEQRDPARYPLFDLAVTESPMAPPDPASLRLTRGGESLAYEHTEASPGEDMVLIHEDLGESGLLLEWHVNSALYTRETASRWFESLTSWASWLAEDFERAREVLPPLLPREAALLEGWEQGAHSPRPALRFSELFEHVAEANADRPAVIADSGITTYGALEREANTIAHTLLARGVVPGSAVGVLTERSPSLPAAVLGIWKAGAIYLPLAADLPPERLAFIARDGGAAVLMALDGLPVPPALERHLRAPLRPEEIAVEFRACHAHRPPLCRGDGAAYIIYTSGTTGQPKGTLVGHDAYVNLVLGAGEIIGLTRDDRCLVFASPSFDVSLSDMGLPLAFGAALCPVPQEVLSSPNRFLAFLAKAKVTVADLTPTYLRLFNGAELASVRILVTGGEPPFPADVEIYAARHRYFNAYGPTENTITSTMGRLSPGAEIAAGRPLPNTSIHVSDPAGNPVPPGVIGELWLGGAGLARGYVGQPALTAAAFVETASGRRYRSGDLGRWRANGEIEILGRIDDQVKLNGIRVELDEISRTLETHPDIGQAVVLLDGQAGANQSLWAFVRPLPNREAPTQKGWREFLSERLPAYMIPSGVISIPNILLSNSGKVDKAALRKLLPVHATEGEVVQSADGTQSKIAALWSELLGRRPIGLDDNFFALGGHSLLAISVAHRLEESLGYPVPARELFVTPTLRGFAARVAQLAASPMSEDVLSDRATEGQREFWVAGQAGLDTRGFVIPLTLVACGPVPPDAQWRLAWAVLVNRHEALRTIFLEDTAGTLRRAVQHDAGGDFEIAARPDLPAAIAYARLRQSEPLAMDRQPLWRAGLVHVATTDQPVFWLALHHSIGDGVSLGVLVSELTTLLQGGTLPPTADVFGLSAGREAGYLAGPDCREDAQYWRNLLNATGSGLPESPQAFDEWPLDFPRPPARTEQHVKGAHWFRVVLDASTGAGLREFARNNRASLHALMLTLMAREVWRRTRRPEFLLGTAASTRDSASEAGTVGYYVNMLPLACRIVRLDSLEQTLQTMQRNLGEGLKHGRYPFARIYGDFRREHARAPDPARYPLFDFAVTENPAIAQTAVSGDFHFAPLADDGPSSGLRVNAPAQDMVLVHESRPDGSLLLQWYVNAAIYTKETAQAWIESLAGWARSIASGNRPPGGALPALLPAEENTLARWEQGPVLPLPAPSFPALFEHWAHVQPERPAVVTDRGYASYRTLDLRSNALARALRECSVVRQDRIGVLTDRSIALPETVLAIWKAGACYVPLSIELPAERLAFIARDAGIRTLVVLDGLELPPALADTGCRVFRPETLSKDFLGSHQDPVTGSVRPTDLAYIIYTSGSTGMPKGVMLHHQGLNNLGVALSAALDIHPADRALLIASPAFDAWISDVAMAWAAGAAVVPVLREEMDDIAAMREKMARLEVSVATLPPSYLHLFDRADFPGLRTLMTVGEPPHPADARHYAGCVRYFNGYGPTENTAAATVGQVAVGARCLTAGKPLANTTIHIRDVEGEPVPPGAVGFIWLGGAGVATGYLNRQDLTAASFVDTPAGRLYCTGDLGRWTCDGELQILGRSDGQVKLRGQRIELGEIEHRLETYPGVRQAVAAVENQDGGTQTLWAFALLDHAAAEPTQAQWQKHLSSTLPSYMLPSAVLTVPAMPLNTAGKVDRAALLATVRPEVSGEARSRPREGTEQSIAQVWAEHLGRQFIAREDNFFDLGGDSLRAIAVVNRLRRSFHCTVNDLYEHPRLADFAGLCRPQPGHLRTILRSAAADWCDYQRNLAAYEAEREAALAGPRRAYEAGYQALVNAVSGHRRNYDRVLLTGATGFVGSYVLRELLLSPNRYVSVLVRASDDRSARVRLAKTLAHYFGAAGGAALANHPRLTVLAGELRRNDLGLSAKSYDQLSDGLRAIFHCAANVKHFGPYWEFHEDNVVATARLLKLAERHAANPADFHQVSTLSVCGSAPQEGFRLFTEYDAVPRELDENYYVRSKQEAERLAAAARQNLANACIHRIGNVVFAADGGRLQPGARENAFFRQLAAFFSLGAVPEDAHVWPCYVDVVARGLVLLAEEAGFTNETHHLENARRYSIADFVRAANGVHECAFETFLERLERAVDEPGMEPPLAETLENFQLYRGCAPQPRARRLEVVSTRTQSLLARLGFAWPAVPDAGQRNLLRQAARLFSRERRPVPDNGVAAAAEGGIHAGEPLVELIR